MSHPRCGAPEPLRQLLVRAHRGDVTESSYESSLYGRPDWTDLRMNPQGGGAVGGVSGLREMCLNPPCAGPAGITFTLVSTGKVRGTRKQKSVHPVTVVSSIPQRLGTQALSMRVLSNRCVNELAMELDIRDSGARDITGRQP